ncbi:hypothetical protein ACFQVA_28160 [Actinomadura keratinilytica]
MIHPDGGWSVVEIKSFPMLDGSADAAKVGAAARQAAVYVLALEEAAAGSRSGWAGPRPSATRCCWSAPRTSPTSPPVPPSTCASSGR